MTEFKRMVFQVGSEEEAKALQEYLFSLGYSWRLSGKQANYLDKKVFITDGLGNLSWSCGVLKDDPLYKGNFENKLVVKDIEKVNTDPFLYNDGSVTIPNNTLVEVIYRDGYKRIGKYPCGYEGYKYKIISFEHFGRHPDIIAYRILEGN